MVCPICYNRMFLWKSFWLKPFHHRRCEFDCLNSYKSFKPWNDAHSTMSTHVFASLSWATMLTFNRKSTKLLLHRPIAQNQTKPNQITSYTFQCIQNEWKTFFKKWINPYQSVSAILCCMCRNSVKSIQCTWAYMVVLIRKTFTSILSLKSSKKGTVYKSVTGIIRSSIEKDSMIERESEGERSKWRVMCETKMALLELINRFGPNAISNIFIELRKVNQMWTKQIKSTYELGHFNGWERKKNYDNMNRRMFLERMKKNTFRSKRLREN